MASQEPKVFALGRRKVFSSNLAHLSLVFFWISTMQVDGAYFSNYDIWLKDPVHYYASAQIVSPLIHQDILNSDIGDLYFQGIDITSGIFQLWRGTGIITHIDMQYACSASLIGTMISTIGSYFHLHISYYPGSPPNPKDPVYKKFKSLCSHHLSLLFGLSSIIWGAHEYHIGMRANPLLDSHIDSAGMGSSEDLFATPRAGETALGPTALEGPCLQKITFSPQTPHHFYVAIVFIVGGVLALALRPSAEQGLPSGLGPQYTHICLMYSWHAELSMNLAMGGVLSIGFANHQNAIPVYPYCASDYARVLSLFYHHIWLGGMLIIASRTHASIFIIGDHTLGGRGRHKALALSGARAAAPAPAPRGSFGLLGLLRLAKAKELSSCPQRSKGRIILKHRDLIIGHLIWVTSALGLHSFSLYIHNDSLQAFCRGEDIFDDNSIQLKPVFAAWVQDTRRKMSLDIKILDKKLIRIREELGSADLIVHHIHAFTIHQALLILCKAILYARNSRFLSDKLLLGFRYPCDGPGRGGTCQISAWDHIYLALFWMYNCLSMGVFHYFWKMQSDVWAFISDIAKIMQITGGDFSVNGTSINAWLTHFLWSGAGQVIQAYATSISAYGFIFIAAHFIWAFSLMFLYSGRGYWQELIESILWCHHKFGVMPVIQAHALGISQGRAVGFIHYTLGGLCSSGAFFISRMVVLYF